MFERIENRLFKARLKNLKKNTIRIAIAGNVSSGKSFLMVDMVEMLSRLNIVKTGTLGGYKPKDHGKGPSGKTEIYLVRKDNNDFYEAELDGGKMIQILDMPGEAFNDSTKNLFYELLNALIKSDYIFVKEIYSKNENDCKNLLKYKEHLSHNDVEAPQNLEKEYYHTVDEMKKFYVGKGYVHKKSVSVTGRYIILHFMEYDTDSVMYAIEEAWKDGLGLPLEKLEEFKAKKKDMFFWFYTLLSTDIIFCYMLASQNSLQKGAASNIGVPFVNLYDIKKAQSYIDVERNYYLVYRGVDSMIDGQKLNEIKDVENKNDYVAKCKDSDMAKADNRLHDSIYSRVATEMFSFIIGGANLGTGVIKDKGYLFNNNGTFIEPDMNTMRRCLQIQIVADGGFCKKVTEENIGTVTNPFPSFLFFTTSAIDNDYSLHKNKQQNPSEFENCGNTIINEGNVANRLCFGTRQLMLSLLYRNGYGMDDYIDDLPMVLRNLKKMMTGTKE